MRDPVLRMPRIFRSDSALPSRISISFLSSMICFLTSSRRWATDWRLASWISLVRSSHSVRFRTESTSLSKALWQPRAALRLASSSASFVFLLRAPCQTSSTCCFDHVEPAVHGPLSPQADERLVAGQARRRS